MSHPGSLTDRLSFRCPRKSPELGREVQTVTLVSDPSGPRENVLHPLEVGAEAEDAARDLSMTGTDPWMTTWKG